MTGIAISWEQICKRIWTNKSNATLLTCMRITGQFGKGVFRRGQGHASQ